MDTYIAFRIAADAAQKQADAKAKAKRRMLDGARRYAQSDKSDPFAYARCVAHINNGVASVSRPANKEYEIPGGVAAYYDADAKIETRKIVANGEEIVWDAIVFTNAVRP